MNIPIRFRYSADAERPASAWLLEGGSAADWLRELIAARLPQAEAKLYLVPTSLLDPTPCGVLVTGVARSGSSAREVAASPRVRLYGVVHRRLFVPVDAAWEPAVTGADVEALLDDHDDALYVWHPRAGLLRFAANTALGVSELVDAGPPQPERWDFAVPGTALSTKLLSLEPEYVPTAQQVLDGARGDIGTESPQADLMPPAPNEAQPGAMAALGRALESGLAGAAMWLAQHMPSGASAPNWLNALEAWAGSKMQRISQSLEAARHRELTRLMNLLMKDPDEGLRFALPIGGDESRGVAPPSSQLGARNVDFRLGGLGGGRAGDAWNVPFQMQQALLQRYRELAAREIQLGRHRRAAYIFANLLNDIQAAAVTLEDGRHFREAAALYEERLKRPLEAARCLRRGGLFTEAIVLYERLGDYETVGDLYAELERTEEAETAWRRAVAVKLDVDDVLAAAVLLERKLGAVDEAYARLLAAWPRSKQATLCLSTAFELLGRTERHETAAGLVDRLPQIEPNIASTPTLVEVLGAQALKYPNEAVRTLAADQTRFVASQRLVSPTIAHEEASRLARIVGDLVPPDKLLPRDAQRFLQQRRGPAARTRSSRQSVKRLRELRLPRDVEWQTAAASDDAIYVAGFRDCELVVARTDWNGGDVEEAIGGKWIIDPSDVERAIVLSVDASADDHVLVHLCGAEPLQTARFFKQSDRFPAVVGVGSHRGLSSGSYGLHRSDRGVLHVVQDGGESLLVYLHSFEQKSLAGFIALDLLNLPGPLEECRLPLPIFAGDGGVYVGIGTNLCRIRPGMKAEVIQTPSPITQLFASSIVSRSRLAVAMQSGGFVLWDDDLHGAWRTFGSEMEEPRITLMRDGTLVAAGTAHVETYSTHERQIKFTGRTTFPGLRALAAVATRQTNRFAILSGDGSLGIYGTSG